MSSTENRLQTSGLLLITGLLIELLSMIWNKPETFIAFLSLSAVFLAAGTVLFFSSRSYEGHHQKKEY